MWRFFKEMKTTRTASSRKSSKATTKVPTTQQAATVQQGDVARLIMSSFELAGNQFIAEMLESGALDRDALKNVSKINSKVNSEISERTLEQLYKLYK